MAMEKERQRGRTRRKQPSRMKRFLHQEGRRYCAMLLSVCLILGNTAGTAFAAAGGEEPTFRITRADLYEALQKAAKEGNRPKEAFLFKGEEVLEKAYQDLLNPELNEDLYELTPNIRQETDDMELRIFASLERGVEPETRYELAGDEKIIFLITNKTEQEQEAVIQVDQKKTEPITVLPGSMLITEDSSGEDGNGSGAENGGAVTGGGGAAGGNGAGQPAEESGETAKETMEEENGNLDESTANTIKPEDSLGEQVDSENGTENDSEDAPEQEESPAPDEIVEDSGSKNDETNEADRTEAEQEQESEAEDKNDGKGESGKETGDESGTEDVKTPETNTGKDETDSSGKEDIKTDDTKKPDGNDSSKGEDNSSKDESRKDENHTDNADKDEGSSDKNEGSSSDKDTADKNDSSSGKSENSSEKSEPEKSEPEKSDGASDRGETGGKEDSSSEKDISLSVSVNQVQRVASILGETATSSDAASKKNKKASSSDALSSDSEQVLEGEAYESILLEKEENGVAVFVTTAANLGLDDDSFKLFTIYENDELKDVTVRVAAESGDLPDDVTLQVKELKEDGELAEQYKDAEEALKREGTQYDGMMALDISFVDPDGNEVEPKGNVQVSIKVKADSLPEDIDPESVSVQHLKEESDGSVQVNQVADVTDETDGFVEVNKDEAVAEFSVDSFSSFTITWKSDSTSTEYFNITVHYVNERGEAIDGEITVGEISLIDGSVIMLESFKNKINTTLKYKGAYYGSIQDGNKIDRIETEVTETSSLFSRTVKRTLKFKNTSNSEPLATLTHNTTTTLLGNQTDDVQSADIYLVYTASEIVNPPHINTEKELWRSKTATLNEDGTYNLNLSISGAIGNTENDKVFMDVLFIVDTSGSMEYTMKSDVEGSSESKDRRIDIAAQAVGGLVDEIKSNKQIDAQYSIVNFSSLSYSMGVKLDWTSDAASVKTQMNALSPNGGTNYQAGIEEGIKQLRKSSRKDAQKIVIFLTDGKPTHRGSNSYSESRDDDNSNNINTISAKTAISGMGCTAFYAVGMGPAFGENGDGRSNLEALCEGAYSAGTSSWYTASDSNNLNQIFKDIALESSMVLCEQVAVTDQLSDNVYVVEKEDGTPRNLLIKVTKKDENNNDKVIVEGQNEVTITETEQEGVENFSAKLKAVYNKPNKRLELIFPGNYRLEPGWTYTITTTIDATEDAYKLYQDNNYNYTEINNKADAETGTHAGNYGIFSNEKAEVTYKYNGSNYEKEFTHPVIQLQYGKLEILKTINIPEELEPSEAEQLLDEIKSSLTFEVTLESGINTYSLNDDFVEVEGNQNQYKLVLDHILFNTSYKVEEKIGEVNGYKCLTIPSDKICAGKIERGKVQTASFTNTYEKDNVTLKVKKQVTGNAGDRNQTFRFSYQIGEGEKREFTLKDGEMFDGFSDIKKGTVITITELDAEGYQTAVIRIKDGREEYWNGTTWLPTEVRGNTRVYQVGSDWLEDADLPGKEFVLTMEESTEITFVNHKSISTPTGLSNYKHPYLWMLAIATFGLMGFSVAGLSEKARKVRNDE